MLYRVAEGGPFDLQVDNGVVIVNVTDDLVNAGILVPVEPDYEAAATYIALQLGISNEVEDGQPYSDAYAVALDVDAALKGNT